MKKIFFVAVAAAVVFASCQKAEQVGLNADQQEISVLAFNKNMTKGYVTGTDFKDTAYGELVKETPITTDRDLVLSAYDATLKEDYFIGKTFTKKEDKKWTSDPAIYYPLGGNNLQFLAYSIKDSTPVAEWENAQKVTLQVIADASKDDILYAAAASTAKSQEEAEGKAVSMVFKHAQAWLTVKLSSNIEDEATTKPFKVNSITWKNIYNSGELTIEYGSPAKASWNFFTQASKDVEMDDANRAVKEVTETPSQLDMLIPEQTAAAFVINYTIGDSTFDYEVPVLKYNEITKFEMGKHYTFKLNFTITEITINPTVTAWVEVEGFDPSPLEL